MTENKTEIADAYAARKARFGAEAEALAARSRMVSNLRGVAFVTALVTGILALSGRSPSITGALAALGIVAFAWLVVGHARVIAAEDEAKRRARVNENAHARVLGKWRAFSNDGRQFESQNHPYTGDLDIFGRGSLFQRVSVAHTRYGERALARFFSEPATVEEIALRQEAVRVLAPELETRQRLEALSLALVEPHGTSTERPPRPAPDPEPLLTWAEGEPRLSEKPLFVWAARLLPPLTIATLIGSSSFGLPTAAWGLPLALAIATNLATRNETARVFTAVSSTEGAFLRYGAMLELVEGLKLECALVSRLQAKIAGGGKRPSQAMAEFRRAVSWFDLRHNGLIHPFANALLCWDVHCTLMLESWQRRSGKAAREWFGALGEIEALSSLAGLAHDEPDFCFPEVSAAPCALHAEALAHPLIDSEVRVPNDVHLPEPGRALLVTGSNMSGKSTLLRALGLGGVMALAGAPVCARRFVLSHCLVRTSMRISDSLESGVSHFYAEIRKLKQVLDATEAELPVLFLLDEILHGTNSRERQIGARWVLAELLQRGAIGAVSTHDMELCRLPDELMARVTQVHFQEAVRNGEMTFDYRLREGPVTAGNALRLMKLVGLGVPVE